MKVRSARRALCRALFVAAFWHTRTVLWSQAHAWARTHACTAADGIVASVAQECQVSGGPAPHLPGAGHCSAVGVEASSGRGGHHHVNMHNSLMHHSLMHHSLSRYCSFVSHGFPSRVSASLRTERPSTEEEAFVWFYVAWMSPRCCDIVVRRPSASLPILCSGVLVL